MSIKTKFYSIPEAAEKCGVSRTTMWNWVKSGRIEAFVTPGGHHRLARNHIEAFMAKSYSGSAKRNIKKTILIVDDEPEFTKALKIQINRAGLDAEIAKDGFEAGMKVLELRPDLVILDLFMPGLDGFEVCRNIKQNPELKKTRVLAVTGFDSSETRDRVLKIGADGYLPKSSDPNTLEQHIITLLS